MSENTVNSVMRNRWASSFEGLSFESMARINAYARDCGFVVTVIEGIVGDAPAVPLPYIPSWEISRDKFSHLSDKTFAQHVDLMSMYDSYGDVYPPMGERPVEFSEREREAAAVVNYIDSSLRATKRIGARSVESEINMSGFPIRMI